MLSVLAALVLGLLTFGLGLHNVPSIAINIVVGAMLIAAIAMPILVRRLVRRG